MRNAKHPAFARFVRRACVIALSAAFFAVAQVPGGGEVYANKAEGEDAGLFEDALRRFEEGDHAGAIIQLKSALQNNPANLPARILIGRALLAVGDAVYCEIFVRLRVE